MLGRALLPAGAAVVLISLHRKRLILAGLMMALTWLAVGVVFSRQ